HYGAFYSLGQTLIKITAPGVPDVYQGTELWDLSYVDPDNRRPVDYSLREKYLEEIHAFPDQPNPEALRAMLSGYADGKIKMYALFRALKERKSNILLFEQGDYIPVAVSGGAETQVLAYARHYQDQWYLIAVPLGITNLALGSHLGLNEKALGEAFLNLPENAPSEWRHVYTGETFSSEGRLSLAEVFASYPVVLLKSIS